MCISLPTSGPNRTSHNLLPPSTCRVTLSESLINTWEFIHSNNLLNIVQISLFIMQSGHITSTKQIFWSFFRRPSYLDYQLFVNEYKKKLTRDFQWQIYILMMLLTIVIQQTRGLQMEIPADTIKHSYFIVGPSTYPNMGLFTHQHTS